MNDRGTTPPRVALLIDADNLSADVIEQAMAHLLKSYGTIAIRRAYSGPQKVIELTELYRRHAIRPMVSVPIGKNSTDIALAVDAMDVAIIERPDVVVIASSDSDYAPLALRLREKGCRVIGIGQSGKTGGDSPLAYDEFIDLAHRKAVAPREASARRSVDAPVPRGAAAPAPAVAAVPASRARTRAQPPRGKARVAAAVALPAEVEQVLQAMPTLRGGAALQLNEVGEALRRHAILTSRNASPSRFLKRLAAYFELAPSDKPRTVRFLGDDAGPA